jgi:hypothetical protein
MKNQNKIKYKVNKVHKYIETNSEREKERNRQRRKMIVVI